jgi:protein-tyrosine phosphatase
MDLKDLQAPAYTELHEDDEDLWTEILPRLWIGGTADHDTDFQLTKPYITTTHFDTVVTLYAAANPVDWFVREVRYGFWDSDVSHIDSEDLFDLVRVAHSDWKRGKRVLIRCQAGWNRSGLIMALVLMREGWRAGHAIDVLRRKRSPNVLCNLSFDRWLRSQDVENWRGNFYGE